MTVTERFWFLVTFGALLAAALLTAGRAHADPYCGPGMNYDWRHNICEPGMPVPGGIGVYPYPLPGQQGPGVSYPPYGGN